MSGSIPSLRRSHSTYNLVTDGLDADTTFIGSAQKVNQLAHTIHSSNEASSEKRSFIWGIAIWTGTILLSAISIFKGAPKDLDPVDFY
jgi:hypothetical protein